MTFWVLGHAMCGAESVGKRLYQHRAFASQGRMDGRCFHEMRFVVAEEMVGCHPCCCATSECSEHGGAYVSYFNDR